MGESFLGRSLVHRFTQSRTGTLQTTVDLTKFQFGEPMRFYGVTNRSMCQGLPAVAGVA